MDFLKWYKKTVESATPEPPAEIWEEIRNELDVDIVWYKIEKDLPADGRKRILFLMAAAASILLIIGVGTFLYLNSGAQGSGILISHIEHHQGYIGYAVGEPSFQTHLAVALEFPDVRQIPYVQDESIIQAADQSVYSGAGLYPLNHLEYTSELLEYDIQLHTCRFPVTGEENRSHRKVLSAKGYYAGLSGNFANTWLLNNKTLQGLRSDDLTASLPSFGYSFGILAGKNIGRNLDIQAEVYLISLTRQNYNEYLHGKYLSNNMQFNYSSFSISGKWYLSEHEKPGRHSIMLGAYAGLLRNAEQNLNGETISLRQDYDPIDFGVITGYEYHFPVGNGFFLGTGFQTRFGLNNIFSGNDLIPDYLNNTRNASINLILSFRYNLN
jgi:hypothetical protein